MLFRENKKMPINDFFPGNMKNSLTKPLKAATTQDVNIMDIIRISIPLKILFKKSIDLICLRVLTN